MQTRGKTPVKVPKNIRKQKKTSRANPISTSDDDLHGPGHGDTQPAEKRADETDDTQLVREVLACREKHATARIALESIGDGDIPEFTQAEGNDAITDLAEAEQAMADAGTALHTYWETVAPEIAAQLESRFAAAHDLLAMLTTDRATAATFARAAIREHTALAEGDPPPTILELQPAVAKMASARAILTMRARAVDDFFKAREPQARQDNASTNVPAPTAKRAKKSKAPASARLPDEVAPEDGPPETTGKRTTTKARRVTKATTQVPVPPHGQQAGGNNEQAPGGARQRSTATAPTPKKGRHAPQQEREGEDDGDDLDGMPVPSADSDAESVGGRKGPRPQRGAEDDESEIRRHRHLYESTNDSDYIWEGDDDDANTNEDWGHQGDKDYDYDEGFDHATVEAQAGIFAHGKVLSGYEYLKGAPELKFPSTEPQAAILERISVSAISQGMVIPVLRRAIGKGMCFGALLSPEAYYVVGPQGTNMATTLTLGYAVKGSKTKEAQEHPACLIFPYRAGDHSILALSDTAIAGEVLGPAAMHALSKNGTITLSAPSNPHRKSRDTAGGQHGRAGNDAPARKCDLMALQRALHHDRAKLTELTGGDPEMKATNPLLLTHIRNQQASTTIADLPVMQSTMLPKFLQFNWCIDMDFSGPGKVSDAVHPAQFLPRAANGTLRTFTTMEDFRTWVDNIEAVCVAVFLEDQRSTPFYRRIWLRLREQFRDTSAYGTVEHINRNFMAHELAKICNQWAALYTDAANINMSSEDFLAKNIAVLQFNQKEWRDNSRSIDISKISIQRAGPPLKEPTAPPAPPAAPPRAATPRQQKRNAPGGNRGMQPQAKKPRAAPAATPTAPRGGNGAPVAAPVARQDSICLKHILHGQDPAQFPAACNQTPPCGRRHTVQLHAGKFSAQDKKNALAGLASMKGTFAASATQYILTNM